MFLLSQNDENQSENGSKNSKIRLGPGHLRNRKKRCCKPKNWGQKVEKHKFFSLFACRFWTGAFTNRCLPYCFLQCFLKASVTTYQKQEVLAEKWPPPGKPVTFYECHPDDHAPAPSVRADLFSTYMFLLLLWSGFMSEADLHDSLAKNQAICCHRSENIKGSHKFMPLAIVLNCGIFFSVSSFLLSSSFQGAAGGGSPWINETCQAAVVSVAAMPPANQHRWIWAAQSVQRQCGNACSKCFMGVFRLCPPCLPHI